MERRALLMALAAAMAVPAWARESRTGGGEWLVAVVMKRADCPVCLAELTALAAVQPQLRGARILGITHADAVAAAAASERVAPAVISDRAWIDDLDLFVEAWGHPQPAVVVFDPCGREVGRILGRGPSRLAAPDVVRLIEGAAVAPCEDVPRS